MKLEIAIQAEGIYFSLKTNESNKFKSRRWGRLTIRSFHNNNLFRCDDNEQLTQKYISTT